MNTRAVIRPMALALALALPVAGYPDDTDIYLTPPAGALPEPLIMMSIDLKANNLSSTICAYDGSGSDECFADLGEEIYKYVQLAEKPVADGGFGQDYSSGKLNRFDIFRAIHNAVFQRLLTISDENGNPVIGRFGMMLSHNEQTADGGYILRGFRRHVPGDTNGAINELMTKLYSLPNPGEDGTPSFPPPSSGSCSPVPGTATMTVNGMTFTVGNAYATEGGDVAFTITGTGTVVIPGNAANQSIMLNIDTVSGTATGGGLDYVDRSLTSGAIAEGATTFSQTVTVSTVTDSLPEITETFQLKLKVGSGNTTAFATGTICNALTAGSVAIGDAQANEGAAAKFTVALSEAQTGPVSVDYEVVDGTATVAGGDLTAPLTGTLTIAPGSTTGVISVQTAVDADTVPETFSVKLSNLSSGSLSLSDDTGAGTIIEPGSCNDGGRYDHKYQGAELHFEFFRYLTGGEVLQGHEGQEDFGSPSATNLDTECYRPGGVGALQWAVGDRLGFVDDPAVEHSSGKSYVSPLAKDTQCSSIHSINLMFGVAQQEAELNSVIAQPKADGGIGEDLGNSNPFANMIAWLYNTDLSSTEFPTDWGPDGPPEGNHFVTTHIVKLGGPPGQFDPYKAAGADVQEPDPDDFQAILETIFNIVRNVLSVSTTFTAASIPVQVFNRADINENVFLALFRVDPTSPSPRPSWYGNLKKLKLVNAGGNLSLKDASTPPIDAVADDGRVKFEALTYWTLADELPDPDTDGTGPDTGSAFDIDGGLEQRRKINLKDGRFVERGGCGQLIPGYLSPSAAASQSQVGTPGNPQLANGAGGRTMYTEVVGTLPEIASTGLAALNADSTVAAELASSFGVPTTEAQQLLCYVRGLGGNNDANLCDDGLARKWLMADALHSRPLALNYGDRDGTGTAWSKANPDIRILLGTNDGLFRMVQNTAPTSGAEMGVENWAFMPLSVMPIVSTLKDNVPGAPHPYGVDGVPVLLANAGVTGDTDSIEADGVAPDDTAWVYFGLRRGGKAYYALDVSNPDQPPKLKWKIDDTMSDFAELGLTFSTPAKAVVNYNGTPTQVLVFGGGYYGGGSGKGPRPGYDNYNDPDGNPVTPDSSESAAADLSLGVEGNAVYIVNADTGALIWKVVGPGGTASINTKVNSEMTHSIAADVTVVDWNGNGIHERAYVGDLGGNVWRIDFPPADVTADGDADGDQRNGDSEASNANSWQALRIAALGDGASGTADDRRFFGKVDFVKTIDQQAGVGVDVLLIGSGGREHPLDGSGNDKFFMIRETSGASIPSSVTPVTVADLANADCVLEFEPDSCTADEADLTNGWALDLAAPGEKALSESFTVNNQTFFNTYVPPATIAAGASCSTNAEGTGFAYSIDLFTARPLVNNNPVDDGLNSLPTSRVDRYCDNCLPPGIPPSNVVLDAKNFMRGLGFGKTSGSSVFRTFWYERDID